MKRDYRPKAADCGLQILFFFLGALIGVFYRDTVEAVLGLLPGSALCACALLLILDSPMAGSLLAGGILPLTTLAFGTVSAVEAHAIIDKTGTESWRLFILLFTVSVHFLMCGWSLHIAAQMRARLRGRGQGRRLYRISVLLMLGGLAVGVLILALLYKSGLI